MNARLERAIKVEVPPSAIHPFTCNVCGDKCPAAVLDREIPTCEKCGSNVRFRWIVHELSVRLFGESLPLKKFPKRKQFRGIGMSDPLQIADILVKRLDYTNTQFHREPRFDIMAEPPTRGRFGFIICSEVFEHVEPPIQRAFDNLAKLLKPEGFVIFSTPYESEGETIEHFPDLYDWSLVKLRSGDVLVNRTVSGELRTFADLTSHGGPGSVLEMRMFSKDGLLANCKAAGFDVTFAENYPEYGILWDDWSRGMVLRLAPESRSQQF